TLAGRIVEDGALWVRARQVAHEVQHGAWPPTHHRLAQAIDLGASGGIVVLAPRHAGAHPQDIADRDALVSRAAQLRQVELAAIVKTADRAIVQRSPDERRGDRLRGRDVGPTA